MSEFVKISEITTAETYPLRQKILRPDFPPEKSIYPQDDDANTHHFGAFVADKIVGTATIFPEAMPETSKEKFKNAWRLRGMAVASEMQGAGIGKNLLQKCVETIKNQGGDALWCNGRTEVFGFYGSFGFEKIGAEFYIPDSGAHFVMLRRQL